VSALADLLGLVFSGLDGLLSAFLLLTLLAFSDWFTGTTDGCRRHLELGEVVGLLLVDVGVEAWALVGHHGCLGLAGSCEGGHAAERDVLGLVGFLLAGCKAARLRHLEGTGLLALGAVVLFGSHGRATLGRASLGGLIVVDVAEVEELVFVNNSANFTSTCERGHFATGEARRPSVCLFRGLGHRLDLLLALVLLEDLAEAAVLFSLRVLLTLLFSLFVIKVFETSRTFEQFVVLVFIIRFRGEIFYLVLDIFSAGFRHPNLYRLLGFLSCSLLLLLLSFFFVCLQFGKSC